MNNLSAKTWQIIQKMFLPQHHEKIGRFLINECGNNLPFFENASDEQIERVRLAVLKLSNGYVDHIVPNTMGAQGDWSDTLLSAGFAHSISEHAIWADKYLAGEIESSMPGENKEPIEAILYETNWVKCPTCGWRFCLANPSSWSGERHKRCGQRLIIISA